MNKTLYAGLFLILNVLAFSTSYAQPYFQKIYKLGDSTSIFHDIYLKDSTYYLGAMVGKGGAKFYTHLVRLDETGQVLSSKRNDAEPNYQFAGFSKTDMDTNFRGNLVFGYINMGGANQTGGQPRITEFDFDGTVIKDILIDDFRSDTLVFFANGTLLQSHQDSSYYLAFAYSNEKVTDNVDEIGTLLFKVKYTGEIVWQKRFRYEPLGKYKPQWIRGDHKWLNDTTQVLYVFETYNAGSGIFGSWSRHRFLFLDVDGVKQKEGVFYDTAFDGAGLSFLNLDDGGMIYAYYEAKLTGTVINNDYYHHKPVIARLDKDFKLVWKDTLGSFYGTWSPYNIPNRYLSLSDSSTLYAFEYLQYLGGSSSYVTVRIENRHIESNLLWYRDYAYYTPDFFNDPETQILDLEQTQKGDLLFCGQVINRELINQNRSGQNAYLLKTNCLGFMGDPKAGVEIYDLGNNQVKLVNTSVQGGGFVWDLGDGTTFTAGDRSTSKQDTIYHTYPDHGTYTVKLIATGCKDKADTIDVPWNWVKVNELTKDRENLLQINPNPVQNNDLLSIYVGQIPQGKHEIQIVNELGQVVGTYPVPQGDVNLGITVTWGVGMYFASLKLEEHVLVTKKIIIQ